MNSLLGLAAQHWRHPTRKHGHVGEQLERCVAMQMIVATVLLLVGVAAFAVAAFREWLGPSPPNAKLWERPMPTFLLAITLTAVGLLLLP